MYYLTDVCQAGNYRHLDCGWRNSQMPPNPGWKPATSIRPTTSQNPRRKSRICTKLWERCIYRQWIWWTRLSTYSGRILWALSHECNARIGMLSIIFFQAMIKAKEAKNAVGGSSCIVGPTFVKAMIKTAKATSTVGRDLIQGSSRPLYCNSMDNLGVCFNRWEYSKLTFSQIIKASSINEWPVVTTSLVPFSPLVYNTL